MRILITGGVGRLGLEIIRKCLDRGYVIRAFDLPGVFWEPVENLRGIEVIKGDITDLNQVKNACNDVDVVVHLAAILPPVSEKNRSTTMRVNVGGTRNIIQSTEENMNTRLIFASSIATYGITAYEKPPIREDHPQSPTDSYSESKIEAEKLITSSKILHTILRIAPVTYADLIELPEVIPYRSDQRVEFINLEDVAIAITNLLMERQEESKIYNIAGGKSWQLTGAEYIERFYRALGVDVDPYFSNRYTPIDWYDTSKASYLNFQNTNFIEFERKLNAVGEELGLR